MPTVTRAVNLSAADRTRRRMARRLGFETADEFDEWEEDVVLDHFAAFIGDYLARGYTVEPDRRELVRHVDLDRAVAERIEMLEARRFEMALDPDKSDWAAKDYYKQFIVGVVADDMWLGKHGIEGAALYNRGWKARVTTLKMIRYLEFLVQEWTDGPGDSSHREKAGLAPPSRHS